MKKLMICAVICCSCVAFAAAIADLDKSKVGANKLHGWTTNMKKDSPIKAEIVEVTAGVKAFKFVSPAGNSASYWRSSPIPANNGDTVKISMDITGKGRVNYGYYNYISLSKFYPAVDASKSLTLDGTKQKVEFSFTIKPGKKGEKCDNIRPFLWFGGDTDVMIENYQVEVIKAK